MPVMTEDLWLQRRGLVAKSEGPVAPSKWKSQLKCTDFSREWRGQYIFKRVLIEPLQEPSQLASLALMVRRLSGSGGDVHLRSCGFCLPGRAACRIMGSTIFTARSDSRDTPNLADLPSEYRC